MFKLIENNFIIDADKRINEIEYICLYYFTEYYDKEKLDMINELRDKIKNQLDSILNNYITLNTSEYFHQPPKDIVSRHRNSDGKIYENFIQNLNGIVINKFRIEISEVMKEKNHITRNSKLKHLRNSLKLVPEEINHIIEQSLDNCSNEIQIEIEKLKEQIDTCFELNEYEKLLELYKTFIDNQNHEGSNKIKSFVLEITKDLKTEIMKDNLNESIINKLIKLFEIYQCFPSLIENISKEIFNFLNKNINNSLNTFKKLFDIENLSYKCNEDKLQDLTGKLSDDTIDLNDLFDLDRQKLSTINHLNIIFEFLLVLRKDNKPIFNKILEDSTDDKLVKVFNFVIESIKRLNIILRKNLSGLCPDIILIKNILSKFRRWNLYIFIKINDKDINYVYFDSDLKCLTEFLEVLKNKEYRYDEYLKLVISNLEKIK